ncbi:MAG: hypothetical protein EHM78_04340 [Myxococcaceae bacterium]|nr:MAG: hypothetical protein EHM78_04340 [Myxococcaceae bacterium]
MASSAGHLDAATQQLAASLERVTGAPIDLKSAPWADIEKGVIRLLMGPFRPEQPEHQLVALGLAGVFADRLISSDQAFWFPHREAPEGGMLGFPEAVLMLSPFQAVMEALSRGKLERLDEVSADIRRALAQARFAPTGGAPVRLRPEDYARLFDPGFLQFIVLDPRRTKELWEAKPSVLASDVRAALGRVSPQRMSAESKAQFEQQIAGALARLDPPQSFGDQVLQAPRLAELMLTLVATSKQTGSAPDEFWEQAVFPLLFTGAPTTYPPLDPQDVEAAKQGVDPLALFLDVVPYSSPAPEDGLLGVFPMQEIDVPHPGLAQGGVPRLLRVPKETLHGKLSAYDPRATRGSLDAFVKYLSEKAGKPIAPSAPGKQMEDAALALLAELKGLLEGAPPDAQLVMRRLTETEALSDPALAAVREAMQGPRIILAP